jgi:hypothetical protein
MAAVGRKVSEGSGGAGWKSWTGDVLGAGAPGPPICASAAVGIERARIPLSRRVEGRRLGIVASLRDWTLRFGMGCCEDVKKIRPANERKKGVEGRGGAEFFGVLRFAQDDGKDERSDGRSG